MTDRVPLNVLIYGDDWAPSGSWLMGEAYARLGHRVRYYRQDVGLQHYGRMPWRLYQRILRRPRERDRLRHTAGLIAAAREHRANLVIVLGGLYVGPDDVASLRANGAWVVNYNYDDFFSRFRSGWSHVQRASLPHYDLLVCTKQYNVAEVAPYNPRVAFILHAYEPRVHRPVPIPDAERDAWTSDVAFVGQWAKHRAALIERLIAAVPAKYAIRGPGWERVSRSSPIRPYIASSHVYGDDMAKALGGAKICLGFLRKENRDDYTTRTFEIPACGGVLLAERTPLHQSLFRDGEEAVFFDAEHPDDLVAKARMLLTDDAKRESIRRAGMLALERGSHTYDHRVRQLLDLYAARPPRT